MPLAPSLSAIPHGIANRVAWRLARAAREVQRPAPFPKPPAIASDRYRRLVEAAPLRNALVLRYEDIVADQAASFDRIFAHARVRPVPVQEAIRDHNQRYLDEWATHYGREAQFARRAFPEMIRLFEGAGYSLEPPFVSREFERQAFLASAGGKGRSG